MRHIQPFILLYVAAALAASSPIGCNRTSGSPAPGTPAPDAYTGAVALGWIEPADGIVSLSAAPGDRVEAVLVKEGQTVRAGEPLVELASRKLREIERDLARQQLADLEAQRAAGVKLADASIRAAEIELEKAKAQRSEIGRLEKKIAQAQAAAEYARSEHQRLSALRQRLVAANRADQTVSVEQVERQRLLAQQAENELANARADLDRAKLAAELAEKAAQAGIDAASAEKEQAQAAAAVASMKLRLDLAEAQLAQARIVAPRKATVL